ncbi:hypothetical protein ABMC88_10350 [Sulfitobacter sp. HNIBRBA2951]|uniref:EF-hand domain-containing protein n=1 Tax=Sulfitobacter aquimarinus TaxID=3158557 RepID=UPI0032E017C2
MKNSKILPVSLIAAVTLVSGLTFATAQTATETETETAPAQVQAQTDTPDAKRANFRKDHGERHGRGGRGMMGMMMEKVDANGDRAVTQEEIDTFRNGVVSGADASGDGDISLAEFETIYLQMIRERMVDSFQKLDADGDGAVTQAEMDKRFGNVVERMDRNGDGQLDREDRRKHHDRKGKHGGDRRG